MRNKYLKLSALILASAALFFAVYIITQKNPQQSIGNYKTSVVYPTTPITMSLWLPSDEADGLNYIVDQYQQIHPNVTVRAEVIDSASYQAKLVRAITDNNLPDLFVFRDDGLAAYKTNLAPAPTQVFSVDAYNSTFISFGTKQLVSGNVISGAPLGIATLGLIYNQSRFGQASISSPPKTWVDFNNTNDKLRQKSGENLYQSGVALGTATIHSYPDIISVLMMQNGATMTDQPPTKATFEQPDATGYYSSAKAVSYYASFAQPSKSNYSWSDSLGDSISAFAQNKTALIVDYPMSAKLAYKQNPSLSVGLASLPQTNTASPINYGTLLVGGVSKNSKNVDIAWDFWGFATSKEVQKQFSLKNYWPPSRKDLNSEQLNDNVLSPFIKQSSTATDWFKGINYDTNNALREMMNNYLTGLDSQIVVNNASTKVTGSIQQANK